MAVRVVNSARNTTHESGIIAHSCGVDDPRDLRRHHCRVVTESGKSQPLDKVFPYRRPRPAEEEAHPA